MNQCCPHPHGHVVTLHTAHGPKTACQACIASRSDIVRLANALSEVPDYTPNLERRGLSGNSRENSGGSGK